MEARILIFRERRGPARRARSRDRPARMVQFGDASQEEDEAMSVQAAGPGGPIDDLEATDAASASVAQTGAASGSPGDAQAKLDAVAAAIARVPKQTMASSGLASDPLNLAFVGSKDQLLAAFKSSGWQPANQGFGSDLEFAGALVIGQKDPDAPMTNQTLLGKKQDLALEKCTGPGSRDHVRFWAAGTTADGQTIWVGAATRDAGITVKKNFFQAIGQGILHHHLGPSTLDPLTHRIDTHVDAERDTVAADLVKGGAQMLGSITGYGGTRGKNADGEGFVTDGKMTVLTAG
jgi:hypothetical protein